MTWFTATLHPTLPVFSRWSPSRTGTSRIPRILYTGGGMIHRYNTHGQKGYYYKRPIRTSGVWCVHSNCSHLWKTEFNFATSKILLLSPYLAADQNLGLCIYICEKTHSDYFAKNRDVREELRWGKITRWKLLSLLRVQKIKDQHRYSVPER